DRPHLLPRGHDPRILADEHGDVVASKDLAVLVADRIDLIERRHSSKILCVNLRRLTGPCPPEGVRVRLTLPRCGPMLGPCQVRAASPIVSPGSTGFGCTMSSA